MENQPPTFKFQTLMMEPCYQLLTAFLAYLSHRLQTEHLDLVDRFLQDHFDGNSTTLREFVRLGHCVIAILPIENDDVASRDMAEAALHRPKELLRPQVLRESIGFWKKVTSLVATREMATLHQILRDFFHGRETTLNAFVDNATHVISIIPEPKSQQTKKKRKQPVDVNMENRPDHDEAAICGDQDDDDEDEEEEEDQDDDDAYELPMRLLPLRVRSARPSSSNVSSAPCRVTPEMKEQVRQCLVELEHQAPWTQVFHHLPLPFRKRQDQSLALYLHRFWKKHGRAVWERVFWMPLDSTSSCDQQLIQERKSRQSQARRVFITIIRKATRRFGPSFFVRLDQDDHVGWWYRQDAMDLCVMCQSIGFPHCLEVLKEDAYKIRPFHAMQATIAYLKQSNVIASPSRAMWYVTASFAPQLLDDMKELEEKKKNQ